MPIKKVKKNDQENSVEIYSDKKTRKKIIKLLVGKNCYYKLHRSVRGSYLKLNYQALKILQNNELLWEELKTKLTNIVSDIAQGLENKEEAFIDAGLKKEKYFEILSRKKALY